MSHQNIFIYLLTLSIFLFACKENTVKTDHKSIVESENDSLRQELEKLKLKDSIKILQKNVVAPPLNNPNTLVTQENGTYAFVVLSVLHNGLDDFDRIKKKFEYTSQVQKFDTWNEDVEYKFMDDVQNSALRFNSLIEKVLSRKCYSYSTYSKASKEREKFVTDK